MLPGTTRLGSSASTFASSPRQVPRRSLQQAASANASNTLELLYAVQFVTRCAAERMATVLSTPALSSGASQSLAALTDSVVTSTWPSSVQVYSVIVNARTALTANNNTVSAAVRTLWASSAFSPRYAKGARPAGVPPAAEKALGAPQLKPKMACRSNVGIAWEPTAGRPRC